MFLALGIGGCAINVNQWGQINVGFDQAQLTGTEIASFTLPEGGSATLRKLKDRYSLKIDRYFRVIEIGPGVKARMLSTSKVGAYSLIWIEKQLKDCRYGCAYSTVLIAIKGFEVKVWEINGNSDVPNITITPNAAAIDVPDVLSTGQLQRYVFSDGNLYNQGAIKDAPPAYVKADSQFVRDENSKGKSTIDTSGSSQKSGKVADSKFYLPSKSLVFSKDQNIKPVVIYLDR